ncbi:MAG: hypothetical protein WBL93_08195 [Lutisporaceae bacterium]
MTNEILNNRLSECGLTKKDLIEHIKMLDENSTVFVYSSHLEGLGTHDSDFDIYVIADRIQELESAVDLGKFTLSRSFVNGIKLDIEYWTTNDILNLILDTNSNNRNSKIKVEDLKILHRLKMGQIIYGDEKGNEIRQEIKNSRLTENALGYYVLEAGSLLEDSIALFKSAEYECAYICARNALIYAIGAYNVKCGVTNLRDKWIPKILVSTNYDKEKVERCLNYLIYSNVTRDSIAKETEELIDYINELLTTISIM